MNSFPFDSVVTYDEFGTPVYDRPGNAGNLRSIYKSFIVNGVYVDPDTNLQVLIGTGLQVIVKPGKCWIEGAFGYTTADTELTIEAADTTNSRIDRIVARLDLNSDVRSIDLYVLKGTAAASPVAPELTQTDTVYEIALADVTVTANATELLQNNITDQRENDDVCGVVKGILWDETLISDLETLINTHATRHGSAGADPITPSAIGAAAASHEHDIDDLDGVAAEEHEHTADDLSGVAKNSAGITITVSSTEPSSPATNDLWFADET